MRWYRIILRSRSPRGKNNSDVTKDTMKRSINFILNQVGLVVVMIAAGFVYYDVLPLTKKFVLVVCVILGVIFVASQLTHRSLQNNKRVE